MRHTGDAFDLIVVGAGMGGLAAAGLAQRAGLRVALLEAHTKLGGCAGYFSRDGFTFDAGATALMGLGRHEPIGALLDTLGVEFQAEKTSSYRVVLPDRTMEIVEDPARFEAHSVATFSAPADSQRHFWRLQHSVGETLFRAANRVPRLPIRSLGDVRHTFTSLGIPGLLAACTSLVTVQDVLIFFGLDRDRPFRSLIAMLLQDTAQAGPETVPFANAAACLQAYRRGMCRPGGGMKALAEGIGTRFSALGGDLRTATIVDRVERSDGEFVVVTRRRHRLRCRDVVFNLPVDLAAGLMGIDPRARIARAERKSRAVWSAFTGYVAFRRDAIDDGAPLFHQVLRRYDRPMHDGNNVLISLSPAGDTGYGPVNSRVATMSTHTSPEAWDGLNRDEYEAKKEAYRLRMLSALRRAIPAAPDALVHAEFASPRSFARYTRRTLGAVGGAPVSRRNANLLAVGPDVLGPGAWLVGDSVFPGQGTMATVISAMRVVERLGGGREIDSLLNSSWIPTPSREQVAPCSTP